MYTVVLSPAREVRRSPGGDERLRRRAALVYAAAGYVGSVYESRCLACGGEGRRERRAGLAGADDEGLKMRSLGAGGTGHGESPDKCDFDFVLKVWRQVEDVLA